MSSEQREPTENPVVEQREPSEDCAGLELESSSLQDVSRGAIQANSGVAVQPRQEGLGLESQSPQEPPIIEEYAIESDSELVVLLPISPQSGSGLESHISQEQPNIEEYASQSDSELVVQLPMPTPSGSGLNSQEQPNVEEGADNELVVQLLTPTHSEESHRLQELLQELSQPDRDVVEALQMLQASSVRYKIRVNFGVNDSQEMQNHEEENGIEARTGIRRRQNVPPQQGLTSSTGIQANSVVGVHPTQEDNDSQEMQIREEDNGIEARTGIRRRQNEPPQQGLPSRTGIQASGVVGVQSTQVDNDSQEMRNRGIEARSGVRRRQDRPPQQGLPSRTPPHQGTARRRMRLQVSSFPSVTDRKGSILGFQLSDASSSCNELNATFPELVISNLSSVALDGDVTTIGAVKGRSESKCVSIASTEGTCICGAMSLEQETGKLEGGTKGPICAE